MNLSTFKNLPILFMKKKSKIYTKIVIAIVLSALFGLQNMHAQTVVAYKGDKETIYSPDEIANLPYPNSRLLDKTAIKVEGPWTAKQLLNLQRALKVDWTDTSDNFSNGNSDLKSIDMGNATLSGTGFDSESNNGLYCLFSNCNALESIILPIPDKSISQPTNLSKTFHNCISLQQIHNLELYTNVTSFASTFYSCYGIQSINLPIPTTPTHISFEKTFFRCIELINLINFDSYTKGGDYTDTFNSCAKLSTVILPKDISAGINFIRTFYSCMELEKVINFETFTNISFFDETFSRCESLKEIRLGTDPNKIIYINYPFPFSITSVYLPQGTTEIPFKFKEYGNIYILPFTAEITDQPILANEGKALALPSLSVTPSFAKGQWELKKVGQTNWEPIEKNTIVEYSYNGAEIRYAASHPEGQNNSASNSVKISVNPYLFSAVVDGKEKYGYDGEYYIAANATSITFTKTNWTAEMLSQLRQEINRGFESKLQKIDMSLATLSGSGFTSPPPADPSDYDDSELVGLEGLLKNCYNVEEVLLPTPESEQQEISLRETFSDCPQLITIKYLEKYTNITKLNYAFYRCESLTKISLPNANNNNNLAAYQAFHSCYKLEQIDNFDKFTNLSNIRGLFGFCTSLREVVFGTDPNKLSGINNEGAFYLSNKEMHIYLPAGVNTIPPIWQMERETEFGDYKNFVIPFTAATLNKPQDIYKSEMLDIKARKATTITPSFAAVKWEIKKDGEASWSNYTSGTPLDLSYNNAYIRYKAAVPDVQGSDIGYSNEVQINVVTFPLSFDANGGKFSVRPGEIPDGKRVVKGQPIGDLPYVSRNGYDLIGWKIGNKYITNETVWNYDDNQVAVAQWAPKSYTLSFSAEEINETFNSISVTYGKPIGELPTPKSKIPYHTFGGWEHHGILTPETLWEYASSSTAYAEWIPDQFNLTIDLGNGNTSVVKVDYQSFFFDLLPTPSRDGYRFLGWTINGLEVNESSYWEYTTDKTVVAQWEVNKYYLYLDYDAGNINTTITVTYDQPIPYIYPPSKLGWFFAGWKIDNTYITKETIWKYTSDKTAKAQWSLVSGVNSVTTESIRTYAHGNDIRIINEENIPLKLLQLINISGQIVEEHICNDLTVYTTNVPDGMYFVRLIPKTGDPITTKIFIGRR